MFRRALGAVAFGESWGRQMRFITGPRQCGKTTLAKEKLRAEGCEPLYYLWDLRAVRNRYKDNELFFTQDASSLPASRSHRWVCFDEIHKMPRWKNILKGVFDATEDRFRFIVTGSAKLDVLRKAGDSLAGRYFTFHLFPLTLAEVAGRPVPPPPAGARSFVENRLDAAPAPGDAVTSLLAFGGFPEPYVRHSPAFLAKWAENYTDRVVREDIGALTRIIDREHLYDLYRLLPEMTGSTVSEASLAARLQLSPPTVKNHLRRLEEFYLVFKLHPYSKNIKRSLLKAPKVYAFDWTRVKDPGCRFENFLAVQLAARLALWRDATGAAFDLRYLRTRTKEETDFLVTRDGKPWLMIEAKLSDGPIDGHHRSLQSQLGGPPFIQVCRQEGVCAQAGAGLYRMSASRLLG